MKKLLVFLSVINFSLCSHSLESIPSVEFFFNRTIWEYKGPATLREKLNPEEKGKIACAVDYDSSSDDGFWIDELFAEDNTFTVVAPEEYGMIAEQLDGVEMSEEFELQQLELAVSRNAAKEVEKQDEKEYLDLEKRLSLYSFGDEAISVQEIEGKWVLVKSDGKTSVRKYYDEQMRLCRQEVWDITGGLSSSRIKETTELLYGEGAKPVSGIVVADKVKHEVSYDDKGRVIKIRNYELYVKNETTAGRYVLKGITEIAYTETGKVGSRYSEEYEYNKFYTKKEKTSSKKEVYEYRIEGCSPDYYYYEDDQLRLTTIYSDVDSYVSTMSFDGGFVVESYYENGKRKKDLFYLNGTVRRTKVYEK